VRLLCERDSPVLVILREPEDLTEGRDEERLVPPESRDSPERLRP
jgi:hypothetical protein